MYHSTREKKNFRTAAINMALDATAAIAHTLYNLDKGPPFLSRQNPTAALSVPPTVSTGAVVFLNNIPPPPSPLAPSLPDGQGNSNSYKYWHRNYQATPLYKFGFGAGLAEGEGGRRRRGESE